MNNPAKTVKCSKCKTKFLRVEDIEAECAICGGEGTLKEVTEKLVLGAKKVRIARKK